MKVELLLAIGFNSQHLSRSRRHTIQPKTNTLLWSEGARVVTGEKQILQNPSLNFI
jgi:hypothetical protein